MPDKTVTASLAAAAMLAVALAAHAQDRFPAKALRIVVPFTPGGVGDTIARTLGPAVADVLGQPVVVENRAGGDGVTGTISVIKAPADGYTILQVSTPQAINMVMRAKPGYDLLRDFAPVARAAGSTLVLVIPASSPNRSVADLVASAKVKLGGLSFGSGGSGSVGHLSGELLKRAGGFAATHVPYKGNSAVLPDLIGGRLDFFFASQPEAVHGASTGHLRAIAVTSRQRAPTFPDLPTMIELGFRNFDPSSFYGYMVPNGTPDPVIRTLADAFAKAIAAPKTLDRFQAVGLDANPGGPAELATLLRDEIVRWRRVVTDAAIGSE